MGEASLTIRPGAAADLDRIRAIQDSAPQAAHWEPRSYLDYQLLVAEQDTEMTGFLAWRVTVRGEAEILNLVIHPLHRRQGAATALLQRVLEGFRGVIYLEVRESNSSARAFYEKLGFRTAARRPGYYSSPPETAVIMKFFSC
jgi:ribosomal-protein-alanine N-acetyltransferase